MKPSGIGGMAVIEGVMMKNKDEYAIAVRKPDNEIVLEKNEHKNFSDKVKLFKLPIFRGILSFIDSMVIGMKVLSFSSSFIEEEEEAASTKKQEPEKVSTLLMVLAVVAALAMSITLFMVFPVLISSLFTKWIESVFLLSLTESVLRILIFIGYILLATRMKEIKRMFMYHGAEHKTINCLENGVELTVENVKWQSKTHKRCGTSFMLYVMLISVIFFAVIRPETLYGRVLSRILLVPLIAGISYEFIRLAGKSENILINFLSKPGLWMQALTTKEPDDAMIEVAIQSVEAVFDWRAFLAEEETEPKKDSETKQVAASRKSKKADTVKKANTGKKAETEGRANALDKSDDLEKVDTLEKAEVTKKADTVKKASSAKKTDTVKNADSVKKADAVGKANIAEETVNSEKVDKAAYTEDAIETKIVGNTEADKDIKKTKKAKKESSLKDKETAKNEYAATNEIRIASPKNNYEEEDDEILRALDKYLDFDEDK